MTAAKRALRRPPPLKLLHHRPLSCTHAPSAAPTPSSVSRSPLPPPPFPVPKPPTPTWYTGAPTLASLQLSLSDLVHRARHHLFQARILTRYASEPSFTGTGIRLRFLRWKALGVGSAGGAPQNLGGTRGDDKLRSVLRKVTWKNREEFEAALGGSDGKRLRISTYRQLARQLAELRALQLYVHYALSLGGADDTAALRRIGEEIEGLVSRFGRPGKEVGVKGGLKLERDFYGRYKGIGRKKEATARAWLVETQPAEAAGAETPVGKVLVNGEPLSEYFESAQQRAVLLHPFVVTRTIGLYNLHVLVHGSGLSSQAHAAAMALSQCLLKALGDRTPPPPPATALLGGGGVGEAERRWGRKSLVKAGTARRDPRVVERKKTGRKGARARYTWVKR